MNYHYLLALLLALELLPTSAVATEEGFDGITCQTNIPSALIGRRMPNGPVVNDEARHKGIGLKDNGAFGIEPEDPWTLISWEICGREYQVLERKDIVRDVLASPLPAGGPQSKIASCTVDGRRLPGVAIVFVEIDDEKWPKPVKHAWLIDNKAIRFQRITGSEIVCTPR